MTRLTPRRRGGLRTPAVAAAAALVVGLLAGCSADGAKEPTRPSSATSASSRATQQDAPDPSTAREDALSALLSARAAAVRGHDRAAFAATLDDPGSGFGLRQLAQYDALAKLPLPQSP